MRDIDSNSAAIVMELWDTARYEGDNFYANFGQVTLDRYVCLKLHLVNEKAHSILARILTHSYIRLFEIYPATQTVFGIQEGDEVFERKRAIHVKALVIIFDSFFQSTKYTM